MGTWLGLVSLLALLQSSNAFTLRVQPHTAHRLRTAPVICAAEDEQKAERSDEQKEAMRVIAQDFFPAEGASAVTRDIASPFAYGKVRTDYPVLKGFSDAELYEGMGDYVPNGAIEPAARPAARLCARAVAPATTSYTAPPAVCVQVIPREPTEAPPVPLEARVYQVLIPLSAVYLAATLIPGSPFAGGGAPSA